MCNKYTLQIIEPITQVFPKYDIKNTHLSKERKRKEQKLGNE